MPIPSLHQQALFATQNSQPQKAITLLQKLLKQSPQYFPAHQHLGIIAYQSKDYDLALKHLRLALKLQPQNPNILSTLHIIYRDTCDWDNLQAIQNQITNNPSSSFKPFHFLTSFDQPQTYFQLATRWIHRHTPPQPPIHHQTPAAPPINLGLLGNCFRDFPTSHNLIGVLEQLNPDQFRIHIYSYDQTDDSPYYHRLQNLAHQFTHISHLSSLQAAQTIARDRIHILLDLKGHVQNHRLSILSHQPAPIQINYLGYPGSTATPYHHYLISDPQLTPPHQQPHFSETLTYLPHCYRPTDNQSPLAPPPKLPHFPPHAFVFSSFNSTFKITATQAQIWAQLLHQLPHTYFWQLDDNPRAIHHLKRFFSRHKTPSHRLVFSPRLPRPKHLQRLSYAHLGLDTFPINGHTTTTDNLFAGTPVITYPGQALASRVSTSALSSLGLSELITHTPTDYFHLAKTLATNPHRYSKLKQKLSYHQAHYPTLNTLRYSHNLQRLLVFIHTHHPINSIHHAPDPQPLIS